MKTLVFCLFLSGLLTMACATHTASEHGSVRNGRARVTLPEFEQSPAEVEASVTEVLERADAELDAVAELPPEEATFQNVFVRMDDILYPVVNTLNRLWLMKETQVDAAMRKAASDQVDRMNQWMVALQYREDLYVVCKAFEERYDAGEGHRLHGEDRKLFEDTMRDYRRAGLHLDETTRKRVEELQNELNELATRFDTNITETVVEVTFTADQLEGVSEDALERFQNEGGGYTVRATVTPDYLAVMQNAVSEETREELKTARYAAAMEENLPLLEEMIAVRDRIAKELGYRSWADYKIEPRMAKTYERAKEFCVDMAQRLEPKFRQELEEYRVMKVADTGDPDAQIEIWDFRYYMNQLQKRKYDVDSEALRVYFELDRTLEGMFAVYEEIFGLEIEPADAPYVWAEGVALYRVSDAESGDPLGFFYLDNFPRDGKYNHFAQFGIIDGKKLSDGSYQRPVVALVCNFTPPTDDKPSLLAHDEVETLFHEFGHALHSILTQADYVTFSGTNVPQDFVEAPSQMLENWVWSPEVLGRFAVDYRDPSQKIDPAVLARLKEADLATQGTHYRRQLCFALSDLRMHDAGAEKDPAAIGNETMAEVFLAPPEGTAFVAYWGHLTGYDAGYYGYAWADSIAADMATIFESAPGGYMDPEVGMRLRNEIYAVGGSRDVNDSIREFLGRDANNQAFVESLGLTASN